MRYTVKMVQKLIIQPRKTRVTFAYAFLLCLTLVPAMFILTLLLLVDSSAVNLATRLGSIALVAVMVFGAWILSPNFTRLLALREPVMELSEAGFLDRRVMRAPIAWSDLAWNEYKGRGAAVMMEVNPSARHNLIQRPVDRVNHFCHCAMGFRPIVISAAGTGMRTPDLAATIAAFEPPAADKGLF